MNRMASMRKRAKATASQVEDDIAEAESMLRKATKERSAESIDLSGYSQSKLNAIARRLNERPRKTPQYETPAERFHQAVALTS